MNPGEVYYLLGKCLALDDFPEYQDEVSGLFSQEDFPWDRLVAAASNHLVLPALYYKVKSCGLQDLLPQDLRLHLENIFHLNGDRNRQILEQAGSMNAGFREAGITPVFIKGVASLALGIYSHPAERMMSDIDCVIPGSRIREAAEILQAEGYGHAPYREEDLPFMHHFPTLSREDLPAPVDLHITPVAGRYGRYPVHWEERTGLAGDSALGPLETVCREDLALLNFLHSQVQDHGAYYARVSLKNLYEFYRLTRSGALDSRKAFQKGSLDRKLENYLALTERTFRPTSVRKNRYRTRTRIFLKRFDLNKSNRCYYSVSRFLRQILFQAAYYLELLFRTMLHRKYRSYVLARLGDRAWPRAHFRHLRRKFE